VIHGIGTDIVTIARLGEMIARHGDRALEKLLAPAEQDACRHHSDPVRFLAKRFAAKEALGKALGTGIRTPVLLPAIEVCHDELGKPLFHFHGELSAFMDRHGYRCHLSLSDEKEQVIAFAIVETP
jgi:holo-[acyl-carrier protein] synthase